jgi:hypothetical protein
MPLGSAHHDHRVEIAAGRSMAEQSRATCASEVALEGGRLNQVDGKTGEELPVAARRSR